MEACHTISDPRPTSLNALRWEVDIYRKGVNDPIDTLVLSDECLPPRKNKRGKIVWRLPTELGRLPSFGTDERRRIMDLFKNKKKNRRKKGSSTNKSESTSPEETAITTNAPGQQQCGACGRRYESGMNADVCNGRVDKKYVYESFDHTYNGTLDSASEYLCAGSLIISSTRSKRIMRKKDNNVRRQVIFRDDSLHSPVGKYLKCGECIKHNSNDDDKVQKSVDIQSQESKVPSKPPGFDTVMLPSTPPGFQSAMSSLDLEVGHEISIDEGMKVLVDETMPRHESHQHNISLDPSVTTRYIVIRERHWQEELFIPSSVSPSHQSKNQQLQNRKSLAVAAAKAFVDLYYPHITHGLSADLAMHYTSLAQKSVSVGGAHSVVTGREDIIVQIASLAGTVFVVRGVVAQDTHDFIGAHVLVTGVVQTATLGGSGGITPFAHSISLIPAAAHDKDYKLPYAFQIHNDALSLMTDG